MRKALSALLLLLLTSLNSCMPLGPPAKHFPPTTPHPSTTPTPDDAKTLQLLQGGWSRAREDGWTYTLAFEDHHYLHGMSNPKFGPMESTRGGDWTLHNGLLVLDRHESGPLTFRIIQITPTSLLLREESATVDQTWHRIVQK